MRERDWTDRPLDVGAVLEAGGLRATRLAPPPALLISGDLEGALARLAPGAPMLGLLQERPETALLRIARDRGLLLGVASSQPGWEDGVAISPATGLYAGFALEGAGVADALAEGTGVDLEAGSPSAAVLFAGVTALLSGRGAATEIWVESAWATYLTTWLAGRQ